MPDPTDSSDAKRARARPTHRSSAPVELPEVLDDQVLAELLGLSPATIRARKWRRKHQLPGFVVAGRLLCSRDAFRAWMAAREAQERQELGVPEPPPATVPPVPPVRGGRRSSSRHGRGGRPRRLSGPTDGASS